MEGLVDSILRDLLTRVGGLDWCVTEFIRVTDRRLPAASFYRSMPELRQGAKTAYGTPVHLQLLGSDPVLLAENAAFAAQLGASAIDLNFGCPAKTVNKSRGGAVLLNEPLLLAKIVTSVRQAVPASIPVTAKMRLGYDSPEQAIDCALALAEGPVNWLVVHARTKQEGYRPPIHWELVARIQEALTIPVYANGDIWDLADWQRCRAITGAKHFMLGRGLVSRPDLAVQIRMAAAGELLPELGWAFIQPLLDDFWWQTCQKLDARYAPGRLKQWLVMLARNYPQAQQLFSAIRRESDCLRITALLASCSASERAEEAALTMIQEKI